jgi:hypothetical protein
VSGYLPFAIDQFRQPSRREIHDSREIFLPFEYVVSPNNFEIGNVVEMVMTAASELPPTIMMPNHQFYTALSAEDVTTDDGPCLAYAINHGLLNPVGPP